MIHTASAGEGPDLVLVHGVGSRSQIFDRVVPKLAAERRVTVADLPGFGRSAAPDGEWTISGVADRMARGLAERIEPPFDVLGSSLGGAVTLALAARHPQLVRRLVLQAPAGFRPAPAPLGAVLGTVAGPWLGARRIIGRRIQHLPGGRRLALAGSVADGSRLDAEETELILGASEGATSLSGAIAAAVEADLRAELGTLRRPLGLIWGDLDRVVPPHSAERILAERPDTPIEWVAGTGHLPHVEAPERFVEAYERVLSQLP